MMYYDIDEIDKISRKVMGFSRDDVLDYNEVVLKYALLLSKYATNLSANEFLNLDYFETLNYSFNHCTGFVLEDYIDLNEIYIKEGTKENPRSNAVLNAGKKVVERFNLYGLEEIGSNMAIDFVAIGNAINDYEKSLENDHIKIHS